MPQHQAARNEAASQNEIARQAFNEYANARGLNTGTSGQAALANSATLQGNLSDISTQESNALAENALQQQLLDSVQSLADDEMLKVIEYVRFLKFLDAEQKADPQ